jgi:hypothetical protein
LPNLEDNLSDGSYDGLWLISLNVVPGLWDDNEFALRRAGRERFMTKLQKCLHRAVFGIAQSGITNAIAGGQNNQRFIVESTSLLKLL